MCMKSTPAIKRKPFYEFIKRVFDILISLIAIIILIPLFIIVSIGVMISSRGVAIFKDDRVGRYGKEIGVFKFRSMVKDAESNIDRYLNEAQKEEWLKMRKVDNDPRVTKFGRLLRKTSIDEFPQFFNVLIGNMSLVGPRPITRYELEHAYKEDERKLLCSVKPGITGNWQVYGRDDSEFESGHRQYLELDYVKRRGLLLDLKLFLLTLPAVIIHRGN